MIPASLLFIHWLFAHIPLPLNMCYWDTKMYVFLMQLVPCTSENVPNCILPRRGSKRANSRQAAVPSRPKACERSNNGDLGAVRSGRYRPDRVEGPRRGAEAN